VLDMLKNLGNMGELIRQAKQMQEKMKSLQEELARKQVTADSAAGAVIATVNGRLELIKLSIDKSRVNVLDTEMLEQLIVSAVSAAQAKAAEMMKADMAKVAADAGLPPGLLP